MKFHNILIIIGVILIILAILTTIFIYEKGIENKKTLIVGPNSIKNYTFEIKEYNNYTIYISATANISYTLVHNHIIIHKGNNIKETEINITDAKGIYNLQIKNKENNSVEVTILLSKESTIKGIMQLTLFSGSICAIGMVVSVIGLGLLLWNRKKEEKQYSRY